MVSFLKRFHNNRRIKRILSLCLALAMIFALLPAVSRSADAATAGSTLYLKPNSNWVMGNARFAAYFFGTAGEHWSSMTDTNDDGIYEVAVPNGNYANVIFCRMNPASSANNWNNKWDQTIDLTVPTNGNNCFTIANGAWNYANGTWSTISNGSGNSGIDADYYLFGYIDRADYGVGDDYATLGKYAFDENGKLTTSFVADSYVGVKSADLKCWYQTDGWLGSVTSATLIDSNYFPNVDVETLDKLYVPGGVEITFTLTVNNDHTVTLSYEADTLQVEDTSGIQDGTTLHAWNWSFSQIAHNMDQIAKMGFTAVQTSPVQPLKEPTNLSHHSIKGNWWVYYQPIDFVITTDSGNALGTKSDLEEMIAVAHEYGIKVIVDVVANHLANATGNDLSEAIPQYLRNSNYWHDITQDTSQEDYANGNRAGITGKCMGGLPDLNTANKDVQNYVLDFLKECIDVGVDGFRFDAAKHIETPDDDASIASDFWPTVIGGARAYAEETRGIDLYCYGETLDEPGGMLPISAYTKYMSVTDNSWGNTLRGNIAAGTASINEGYNKVADPGQLVIWAESHDTFADGSSSGVSDIQINRTWALIAARADIMGLYLARPNSVEDPIGTFASSNWTDATVKAANQFHTHFVGEDEIVSTYGDLIYVERGNSGVVIVAPNAAEGQFVKVDVPVYAMEDGTYTDQLIGMDYTVSNGRLTGTIYINGVSVIYNKPACAHEHITTTTYDPTCEDWGQTYDQCDDCDAILYVEDLEPTGHSYTYTNSGNTHTVGCENGCGYSVTEVHTYENGSCICGATNGTGPIPASELVFMNKALSLQSYIAFDCYVTYAALEGYDSWYVVFERYDYAKGTTVTETVSGEDFFAYAVRFEYKVNSYQMSDTISATIYAVKDGKTYVGETYTNSVAGYVNANIANASSDAHATVYANLVTYGAKAQVYMKYNVENLADAGLGEYASYVTTTVPTAESVFAQTNKGLNGAQLASINLGISAAVEIQTTITLSEGYSLQNIYGEMVFVNSSGKTVTQRVEGTKFDDYGVMFIGRFNAMTAVDGRVPVEITIYDLNGNAISETWTYSVASYLDGTTLSGDALATLYALVNYYDSAAAFF